MPSRRRSLRWSTPPADLVPSLNARHALAFVVWRAGLARRPRHVRVALVPLSEVREGILLGNAAQDWLVWQSINRTAVIARLPTDADRLADRLGVGRSGEGAVLRQALRQLVEELYGERIR